MKPKLININSVTKEIKQLAFIQNSKIFNYLLLSIFIILFTTFIIIFYKDSQKYNRKNTINKLNSIIKSITVSEKNKRSVY